MKYTSRRPRAGFTLGVAWSLGLYAVSGGVAWGLWLLVRGFIGVWQ